MIKINNISKLINASEIERKELSKRLNISIWHLSKIENHKKPLTLTMAVKMAEIFKVTLNDIFFTE